MTATAPERKIMYPKVRRVRFPFEDSGPKRMHFAGGDIAFSHLLAQFSFAFPPGEEFFIRSVRRFSDEIADVELKKRVAAFVGQELVHGQQHRELNKKLVELGYEDNGEVGGAMLEAAEERIDKSYANNPAKRRRFRLTCLAMTLAGEHFTAIQAERLLTTPKIQALMTDPWVRDVLIWHHFEELEHKSVAFDVYRAVGGPEELRIKVMKWFSRIVYTSFMFQTWISIARTDPYGRWRPFRVLRETIRLFNGPFIGHMRKMAKPYLREGFHPDQHDTTAVVEEWQAKLFGENGLLLEHLK